MLENLDSLYRAILKSIKDGIIAVNGQARILFINPTASLLTGWQDQEAVGQPVETILHLVDKKTGRDLNIRQLIETFQKTGPLVDYEISLRRRDGSQIPVEATLAPMHNPLPELPGAVIGLKDTSELQRSIEQMKLYAKRLEILLGILSRLNSTLDLDKLLSYLLEELTRFTSSQAAVVYLLNEDSENLDIASTYSAKESLGAFPPEGFNLNLSAIERIAPKGQSIIIFSNIKEIAGFPFRDILMQAGIQTVIIAKLQVEDEVIGAVTIANFGSTRQFTSDDFQFMKGLADQASIAIANARLFAHVKASRARMQALSKQLVEVQEAERRMLARELHDEVGQNLTGLLFSLETAKKKAEGDLIGMLADSEEMVSKLMKQIRDISTQLLPSMLEDLGLAPTLTWLCENYARQTGLNVDFQYSNLDQRFSFDLELAVYRIVQEALTNAARYARTDYASVQLTVENNTLSIKVQDFGSGFDVDKILNDKQTFGLNNMRERAYLLGGVLLIKSSPDNGTKIDVSLPVDAPLERRRHDR